MSGISCIVTLVCISSITALVVLLKRRGSGPSVLLLEANTEVEPGDSRSTSQDTL